MSLSIAKTIQEVANIGSTTEKVSILQANDSELLRKILLYSLDPYKIFGVKKFEFGESINVEHLESPYEMMFDACDLLMNRKLTGDAARGHITKVSTYLSKDQQEIFGKILKKDLRAGIATGLVNKAFDNLIPEFEIQLAQPEKYLKKVKFPCLVQPKLDGVRTIAITNPTEQSVIYYSRNGKEFKNFNCFDKELLGLTGTSARVFDGEVVGPPGNDFKGIMEQCRRKFDVEPKGLNFYIFDHMYQTNFVNRTYTTRQLERTEYLEESLNTTVDRIRTVESKFCKNMEEVEEFYAQCVEDGFEGIIIKDIDGEYEFKRSNAWVKMKPSATYDLKIIDVFEGRGKYEGKLGGFVVEGMIGDKKVKSEVGSGLKDHERLFIGEASVHYVGKTIEVKFDSITDDCSLRFPRYIRLREDK